MQETERCHMRIYENRMQIYRRVVKIELSSVMRVASRVAWESCRTQLQMLSYIRHC